ncbi:1,4-alpha-glucan branching protein GlgB [Pseudoxanthomonas winnipegensis]|jgi:1,4-alpha-glucan branching enzyme|uniref:1,4-alpha-glucan branching enzyme GlgB n=1 Tax=Pseudoxanthomonas winnipegensis TaxID=2480810 RepID=A0ABY1WET6_9GAMM|nr:1,4-alpha-glucan branching protein GlgB [Pseudoxanthomonas winnipegensis]TAA11796.1 1,4-alpha-glucan branching protein GlgB [Pseudoxanthomonas winnipegensis]TAA19839.1 1,4-alpha-glucan branching protein GlgB [Pseudoxanthomonas winnipegensis]TAH70651.1 1,4-alpha-glucan branching protein GlgB [Pseudoxanthomonas winnipegensis]
MSESDRAGQRAKVITAGEGDASQTRADAPLDPRLQALVDGHDGDPFALLGPRATGSGGMRIMAMAQGAEAMAVLNAQGKVVALMRCVHPAGLFEAELPTQMAYRLRIAWPEALEEIEDPYRFGPALQQEWLHGIVSGDGESARLALGAHRVTHEGVDGVRFAVWAPNARRVSVVGDFNGWDGRRHPMRLRHDGGVWELFLPGIVPGMRYKYEITAADGTRLPHKADPMARQCELPPATASVVPEAEAFAWTDVEWMARRAARATTPEPISIYELHAGSWRLREDGRHMNWDELADALIPYVQWLGFTHIELLPITEYPFGGSWGYQPLGMYAPTARYGSPEGFARFVDACHNAGIGVILDWVSAHFPNDAHGLQRFDGTALYEHADPKEGFHKDWNTLIYNYGRHEVSAYLVGSALEWIERYHIDGLRVDAVASMLYRDYSRSEGEWVPNQHGGRENLEAVEFIRRLNGEVGRRFPGVMMIAEESTAWGGVTQPPEHGGLGFTHKWNMGWMHDTLEYMKRDPIHRKHHHSEMTFGMVYAFSERFVLPLSHDEVVHGKGSLLTRMPGDAWQRFANLRAYFGFMWAHPGRKLLFMGGEFGQWSEWNHDTQLDWGLMQQHEHHGLAQLVGDLNRLLCAEPALYRNDHTPAGFDWSVGDDHANSVFAFVRFDRDGDGAPVLAVSNFTPMPRYGYRVGVPRAGQWREILNTDSGHYGGSNVGNAGAVSTEPVPMHGHAQSLSLALPPLSTIWLRAV